MNSKPLVALAMLFIFAVARPDDGDVSGWVQDASTGAYLSGATVTYIAPPGVDPGKRKPDETDRDGKYTIRAPLGRNESHNTFKIDLLVQKYQGPENIKRAIDTTIMILRVSKPGYRTFVGPVEVNGASLEPFEAFVDTVHLQPERAPTPSFAMAIKESIRVSSSNDQRLVPLGKLYEDTLVLTGLPVSKNHANGCVFMPLFPWNDFRPINEPFYRNRKEGFQLGIKAGLWNKQPAIVRTSHLKAYLAYFTPYLDQLPGKAKIATYPRLVGYGYAGAEPERVSRLLRTLEQLNPSNCSREEMSAVADQLTTAWPEVKEMVARYVTQRFGARRPRKNSTTPTTATFRSA